MNNARPLLNEISPPGNSFVLPHHKIVYMSVTKAACTSLRWMIADLNGEDPDNFFRTIVTHQSRLMTIHNRRNWKRTPQLADLSPDQLADISPDNGWFVFAVVRDPWSRLWSAWQSKFLVRHTPYLAEYGNESWFPRVPDTPEEVVEDYRRFVLARPWETHPQLSRDVHFLPQVRSVRPHGVNYTKVYDISEMSTLLKDVTAHIDALGLSAELYTPRANETPLAMTADVLQGGVSEVVEDAYREDFAEFGDNWSLDRVKVSDEPWSHDAIRLVQYHTTANQRLGDVGAEAKRMRSDLRDAKKKIKRLRAASAQNRQQEPSTQQATGTGLGSSVTRTWGRLRSRIGR